MAPGLEAHLLANIHNAASEDYEVNCIRSGHGSAMPVMVEKVPQPWNLFGWVGRRAIGEQAPVAHFSEIRGGSILQADRGVLIVNAADFYSMPTAWTLLKSCLKYGMIQMDDSDAPGSSRSSGLRPDPIPIQVKLVLLGDFALYDHLFEVDPDFREIFKIRVDFDSEVDLTARVLRKEYPAFIAKTCQDNGLRPVTARGVARALSSR